MIKPKEVDCPGCGGAGKFRLFKDCDPIEGYKLAPYYTCLMCEGAKVILETDERYTACIAYWAQIEYVKKARKSREDEIKKRRQELRDSAIKKLTLAEREALGVRDDAD